MIINNFGEELGAENIDGDHHHNGERSENGDCCVGLDTTDLASDHTHEEAQTDAVDEDFEAELENHPDDMLDPDGDGQYYYGPQDLHHPDDYNGHDNQEPPDYQD